MRRFLHLLLLLALTIPLGAQRPAYHKMSSMLRKLAAEQRSQWSADTLQAAASRSLPMRHAAARGGSPMVCAFVRLTPPYLAEGRVAPLADRGCRVLARFGDIFIASVPLDQLAALSLDPRVTRIEAGRGTQSLTDSVALQVHALPAYQGLALPQAYTGAGVVVGVMDIGFDLTHPTFYDSTATTYRIKRLWDHLSRDTVGSTLYVGADYSGREALLAYAHSRDGLDQTHGTHTAGIAAGSGYDSHYRGLAYESDLCLVSNAVTEDIALIDSADYYKYTYATDALGFKYIFDYAQSVGKPCVINFSEGSLQDFRGDDQLYYAILDSITGPGRILVVAAGNTGQTVNYIHKPVGVERAGRFHAGSGRYMMHTLKSADPFTIRLRFYPPGQPSSVIDIATNDVLTAADSTLLLSPTVAGKTWTVSVLAYASCYQPAETAYDLMVQGPNDIGTTMPLSVEMVGTQADVELYRGSGSLVTSTLDPTLTDGEASYGILSPGSAPGVICVGANSYRRQVTNYNGTVKRYDMGTGGQRGPYSSVGPTFDRRIKPDVMAPGTNIISSYSSYYLEKHPTANDIDWDVEHFEFNGRTYAWNCNSGTSMASPVVAGALALWLEADPTLSAADCLDIFARTCVRLDSISPTPNNLWGYGQIDVYAGLLEVLRRKSTGLASVLTSPKVSQLTCRVAGTQLELSAAQPVAADFKVSIYTTQGIRMQQWREPAGRTTYRLDISRLPKGVYVLRIDGPANISGGLVFTNRNLPASPVPIPSAHNLQQP